jgi:hypothetical protein
MQATIRKWRYSIYESKALIMSGVSEMLRRKKCWIVTLHPLLKQAAGIVHLRPDSARVLISKADTASLSEADIAEYHLLKSDDRLYRPASGGWRFACHNYDAVGNIALRLGE